MIGGDTCTAQWLCDQLCSTITVSDDDVKRPVDGLLVLDCRSAEDYATSHVSGSLPVVVPSILLRRLRTGSGSVAAIVSDQSWRTLFTARYRTSQIVLYDDCGSSRDVHSATAAGPDSVVDVLMSRLKKDGCRVSYLLGTFSLYY